MSLSARSYMERRRFLAASIGSLGSLLIPGCATVHGRRHTGRVAPDMKGSKVGAKIYAHAESLWTKGTLDYVEALQERRYIELADLLGLKGASGEAYRALSSPGLAIATSRAYLTMEKVWREYKTN